MMNLVDYGSDSSDNEDATNSGDEATLNGATDDTNDQSTLISRLPTVSDKAANSQKEGDLEDFLKSRKQWEKELAEEAKSEKTMPKMKKKNNVFGELGSLLNKPLIDEDEEIDYEADRSERHAPTEYRSTASGSSLLQLLPQPNKKIVKPVPKSVLLPSSLTPKQAVKRPVEQIKPVEVSGAESDEDEEDATDFFGLNAKEETPLPNQPLPSFVPQAQLFQDAPMPGPSRPTAPSNYRDQDEDEVPKKKSKTINDERAQKLIYDAELSQWGVSDNVAREAVMNIREVNVDQELGPNVRQTLLRNLNNKAMAQASAVSLPSVKKDPQNKLAKQKHQITHLAALAVAREEQLQEQWADSKAKRVSTAKRYGFR